MIVVVATLLGFASVKVRRGRLTRLAQVELHHLWIVWVAIVVQTIIFQWNTPFLTETVAEVVHIASYLAAFVFLWLNRHLPGAALLGVGAGANAAAIFANGGTMPASATAWERSGLPVVAEGQFENSNANDDAHLAFLGDIFWVPEAWPLSNVFSIGDILIVLAGTWFAHRWCCVEHVSNAWPAPSGQPRVDAPGEEPVAV